MKIYWDLVLLLNFSFDFLLLLCVSILLRRNVRFYKLLLGAFIGSISILFLFIKITSLQLFLLKIFISFLMLIVVFKYKNLKYFLANCGYFYMASLVLGGCLYFLNVEFSYKHVGLVFYHNGLSINFIFLFFLSPIILYIYIKQGIRLRRSYNNYYKVDIYINDQIIRCNGYFDTGNNLVDPYKGRPIILVSKDKILPDSNVILVPFQSCSGNSLLRCFPVSHIVIKKIGVRKNVLVGVMNDKINIDGIDCLLNNQLMEGK
ncbi:MAG: sigma-E processing peptidase SpoIIGA [Bacilli bacterium]